MHKKILRFLVFAFSQGTLPISYNEEKRFLSKLTDWEGNIFHTCLLAWGS
ncbi:hypothetical protein AM1_B0358 (plasmid) [Acaryochloris marina MBIC11017]|uniref:Uncharacterized protein n=1 Tax=Acaryochloris marina (strain MBIC 11017) TaxID=329726 RepID=A8ZLP9_ACAM1|nr:hypothetical protein AM1_B0358 [Acaryochloris marina MBIC11017]